MSEEKKDYIKVADLTKQFYEFVTARGPQEFKGPLTSQELLLWQCQFQLAIAQQLTVISGHLGRIVGKAENL